MFMLRADQIGMEFSAWVTKRSPAVSTMAHSFKREPFFFSCCIFFSLCSHWNKIVPFSLCFIIPISANQAQCLKCASFFIFALQVFFVSNIKAAKLWFSTLKTKSYVHCFVEVLNVSDFRLLLCFDTVGHTVICINRQKGGQSAKIRSSTFSVCSLVSLYASSIGFSVWHKD